ncbi:hypothetical protein [Paracraurococcus lichenis]|uniref:Calcium-binding protein n=1 Tax=Paracraurococcus lichenis TaxID=3064888 RepID=A0ABT9DZG5_9PROT|nr:hypothetical protein [Paracraurococcus sp. LOR1-02]MDO9709299.1 hypothetical protein [Paracraurococcus sp. LOR1-02]
MPLPSASAGQIAYGEYGDSTGTLAGRSQAGPQSLPLHLTDFLGQHQTGPASVYLTLTGDADTLSGQASGGDDHLFGAGGTSVLFGDARLMQGQAQGGADVITAGGFRIMAFGDAELMSGHAQGGHDDITGSSGQGARAVAVNDLFGDAYALAGNAQGGNDHLVGGGTFAGTVNRLYGDGYQLSGHAVAGDDVLVGGRNAVNDFWGDAAVIEGPNVTTGHDTFVLRPDSQANTIHDFEAGKDLLDMTAFAAAGIHSFADLAGLIQDRAEGSFLLLGSTPASGSSPAMQNSLLVLGDHALAAGDFLFA